MVDGNANCENCVERDDSTEIFAGRKMIYCRAVDGLVFPHLIGDCLVWKERED
jgi:hypothetical protein